MRREANDWCRSNGQQSRHSLWECGRVAKQVTNQPQKGFVVLSWPLAFLIIAFLAALVGFTGIAGPAAWMARVLSGVFLVLFLASLTLSGKWTPKGKRSGRDVNRAK